MNGPWLAPYPSRVSAGILIDAHTARAGPAHERLERCRPLPAYRFIGWTIGIGDLDLQSQALAEAGLRAGCEAQQVPGAAARMPDLRP